MARQWPPSPELLRTRAVLLESGSLYEDPDFPPTRYVKGVGARLDWKRPKEIVKKPRFIQDGASRYDIHQGALKDCFLLAGAACLAVSSQSLFSRVVPPDQSFRTRDYTGLFHFNFWQDDSWVEVWVDDRIPTYDGRPIFAFNRTKGGGAEFWVALMEKAYAKLQGGFENINGGYINEALVDMTGGVSEKVVLVHHRARLEPVLFDLLVKTSKMASLIGCSIESEEIQEEDMGNGLYGGHAYSVTSLAKVDYRGELVPLIRLRNPWGYKEWAGPWSDGSKEWDEVPDEVKDKLGYYDADDGEFWMSYTDWLHEFEEVALCHLTPDAFLMELNPFMRKSKCWHTLTFRGQWVLGESAGGCGNKEFPPELYWTNPQYIIEVPPSETEQTIIVSLNQTTRVAKDNKYISFKIFKLKDLSKAGSVKQYQKKDLIRMFWPKDYMNVREVTGHFLIESGSYVIIPSTFDPGMEGKFTLRIFAEKKCKRR